MVAVEFDRNYIDAEPMKSRTAKELTEAYKRIYARWKAMGSSAPIGTFLTAKHLRNF